VLVFELSPNCSLSPRSATLFYASVVAVCLPVAVACAAAGFWPVLPFAGLELAGLAVALRLSLRRGQVRETIRIDEREVTVGRASGREHSEHRFARPWTRVQLRKANVASWPSRLLVGAMGRSVEVGAFLTEGERRRLGRRLAEVIPATPR